MAGAETVLTFAARGGKGYGASLALGSACVLFFGYGVFSFLKGWIVDHEEILPAGVVLFLLLCGGLAFGAYVFDRLFYARTEYRLGPDGFRMAVRSWFNFSRKQVARSEAVYVLQVTTPPQQRGMDDTWKTLLFYGDKAHPRSFAFEGVTREESEWLAPILARWAGVSVRQDSTVSDAI